MPTLVVTDIHDAPSASRCLSARCARLQPVKRLSLAALSDAPGLSGAALHDHLFRQDGMARAVGALRDVDVTGWIGLGYSAGGTALWRAVQQGAPLSHLFCVSSTRLRSEGPIAIPHRVFFGAEDPARPNDAWVRQVPKRATVFDGAAHDYYLDTASRAVRETERRILSDLSDPSTLPNHAK